jgi:magnesium transporter
VDFIDEPPELAKPILQDIFGFHPLAIDDALEETHLPKLDDWGDYLYLVLRVIVYDEQAEEQIDLPELDLFLGKNYIVTHHDDPIGILDQVWTTCQENNVYLKDGVSHLFYKLLDDLVSGYMRVAETFGDAIDRVEDQLFDNPTPAALEEIFNLKRSLLYVRRVIVPQREVLHKLAWDQHAVIKAADRVFFRDVYDHLVRLYEIFESMRELLGSALNTYLSVVNNRMNDVMKTLTIITTLFMPLSFIVGFFGMNFFQATRPLFTWTSTPVFGLTLAVTVLLPVIMYFWVRRRGWV